MYQFKRLLVALDLTKMDEVLINYASFLAKKTQAEKVYFFHIAEDFKIPEEVKRDYPNLLAPTDEALSKIIEDTIQTHWKSGFECEKVVELKEGNPADQLLKWIDNKEIDMVVMGRKQSLKGAGVLPQKITHLAHSSVMLVPENASFSVENVVVPLDFSKHSKLAIDNSMNLSGNSDTKLDFVHVYSVPTGYHKTGKSFEEFAEIMKGNAQRDYQDFLKKFDIENNLKCALVLNNDNSPSDEIFEYAEKKGADLIIMGSKGRTGLASILLGSVASKVISYDTNIPLLIVKEKEENMGFIKALLNI